MRNTLPRVKGSGASRRFKVISGFTGTGTGGSTTLQGGINESTTNTGPGGLAYIRPPYISYAGYDVSLPYVSWGLSDSVSWQAEYQGQGFEDIRSLSNTALLYATMLLDERYDLYGRGSLSGYAGALGTPGSVTLSAVAASVTPAGSSTLSTATYWVIVAADGGDLLGVTGGFHQGPTTAAASVAVTSGQAIEVTVGTDVAGALGYNLFVASVGGGPFCYAGRTGYDIGFVTAPPSLANGTAAASASDASAVATNFDGLLTNLAGLQRVREAAQLDVQHHQPRRRTADPLLVPVRRGEGRPGRDLVQRPRPQPALQRAPVGQQRQQLPGISSPDQSINGVKIGAIVQSIYNQITGKELDFKVHQSMQGNDD